ncbi:MAG: hypothetical protein AB7V10_09785, partial [Leucobacter sp.]
LPLRLLGGALVAELQCDLALFRGGVEVGCDEAGECPPRGESGRVDAFGVGCGGPARECQRGPGGDPVLRGR